MQDQLVQEVENARMAREGHTAELEAVHAVVLLREEQIAQLSTEAATVKASFDNLVETQQRKIEVTTCFVRFV